jgi:hypothetical protein
MLFVLLALAATRAPAQFRETPSPGTLPEGRISNESMIRGGIENARWEFGALRVDPWIGIRQAGFVNNVFSRYDEGSGSQLGIETDFVAVAGAGLRAYLPLGRNVTLSAHLLPEYVFRDQQRGQQRLNGRYGGGLFAYFNRLDFELTATRVEDQRFVSSEVEQLTNSRSDELAGVVELRLVRSLYLVTSAAHRTIENLDDPEDLVAPFDRLDRDEDLERAGLRVRLGHTMTLGAGLAHTDTRFDHYQRSSTGDAPYLEFVYAGPNLRFNADVARWDIEPEPGSLLVPFESTAGELGLHITPERRFSPELYARRHFEFSVSADQSHFEEERLGGALALNAGRRLRLRVFGEDGTRRFESIVESAEPREDDVYAFGANLDVSIARRFGIGVHWTRDVVDSPIDGRREIDRVYATAGIGAGRFLGIHDFGWP